MFLFQKRRLKSGDPKIRKDAVQKLGNSGSKRVVIPLIEALEDKDKDVRIAAAYALGQIGDNQATEPLLAFFLESKDWYYPPQQRDAALEAATYALGQIGDTKVLDPLVATLEEMSNGGAAAATVLGELGDLRAFKPLLKALATTKKDIRDAVTKSLDLLDSNWNKSEEAKEIIGALLGYWQLASHRVEIEVLLRKIDPDWLKSLQAKEAQESMIWSLGTKDLIHREAILNVLSQIDLNWPESHFAQKAISDFVAKGNVSALETINLNWREMSVTKDAIRKMIARLPTLSDYRKERQVRSERQVLEDKLRAIDPNWKESLEAKEIIPDLFILIPSHTYQALSVLNQIPGWNLTQEARHNINILVSILLNQGSQAQISAARALKQILSTWEEDIPTLQAHLENFDEGLLALIMSQKTDLLAFQAHDVALMILSKVNPDWQNSEEGQRAFSNFANRISNPRSALELRGRYSEGHRVFRRVIMPKANLGGEKLDGVDLQGANLSQANLFNADLSKAKLIGADLTGADLGNARLVDTDFTGANLQGANLVKAILTRADFSDANLRGTVLSKIEEDDMQALYLSEGKEGRGKAEEAYFSETKYNSKTIWPDNFNPKELSTIKVD